MRIFCCTAALQVSQLLHTFPISFLKADTSDGSTCVADVVARRRPPEVATSVQIFHHIPFMHCHLMSVCALLMSHYSRRVHICMNATKPV
jgi:hypothetical protein